MALAEWSLPYEAPTSLDTGRVLGSKPMRPTLWTLGIFAGISPLVIVAVLLGALIFINQRQNDELARMLANVALLLCVPTVFWLLFCVVMRNDWGQRPAEHWLKMWLRYQRLPKRMERAAVERHFVDVVESSRPRGAVEVIGTENLRLAADESLGSAIQRFAVFLNGLRFPVQVVIRAWNHAEGGLERRWFLAITADEQEILDENLADIMKGLSRAGLKGQRLAGDDLSDTLQRCWTHVSRVGGKLGPMAMQTHAKSVEIDGEHVRGFVLSRMPRVADPNWLAPLLDGDKPFDCSLWLDPTDTATELEYLAGRISEWETAQVLNFNRSGYRDPDMEDSIKDAQRTRMLLRQRRLRVFLTTFGFVVRGKTEQEMLNRERELGTQIREMVGDESLLALDLEQDRAPLLVVPIGEPAVRYPMRAVTPALARSYPFGNSNVSHPHGVDVGVSVGSMRRNLLNPFCLANPHVVVLGTSGAGKGFWVKVFIWRMLHAFNDGRYVQDGQIHGRDERVNMVVIQAEKNEYTAIAAALKPIPSTHPELGPTPRSLIIPIRTLEDWDSIYLVKSTLTLRLAQYTVYDLTRMRPEDRGKAIALLLRALEQHAERDSSPRHMLVVVDELGILLDSAEAAQALDTAYRRFRSIPHLSNPQEVSRIGMIGVSQRPSDLLKHPRARVLADLALTHVLFRQKSTELASVARELQLSHDEQRFLDEQCDEGTGLLIADRARVGFHLEATHEEFAFART